MKKRDPRFVGFLIGFSAVMSLGLVAAVTWGLFRVPAPEPTLAPSAVPISERVARDEKPTSAVTLTPSPESDTGASALRLTQPPGEPLPLTPPGPLPTVTPEIGTGLITHTVSSGETLIGIAMHYSVTLETILAANDIDTEMIQPGWQLYIPLTEGHPVTPLYAPLPTASILRGDLAAGYPLTIEHDRFTMHYQPDTPAAQDPEQVLSLVTSSLEHIEVKLQVQLAEPFDVYVAGSLFAAPDHALRGRSFSSERRNFYLYDGSGSPNERRYVIIHELTHLVAWNTLGPPASVMLHEGLAVYAGTEALTAAQFIPLSHFCTAYQQVGTLPYLAGDRAYMGHIQDLDLYFATGCFVEYLIESYGLQDFKRLFTSGDYLEIYGRPLSQLEMEWRRMLEALDPELGFDAEQLVSLISALADAYTLLFAEFSGTPTQLTAYHALDQARIAVLQARFAEAGWHFGRFEAAMNGR